VRDDRPRGPKKKKVFKGTSPKGRNKKKKNRTGRGVRAHK